MQLSEQEVVRREKLSKLRELGINPYPADLFPVNHNSKQIKESFTEDKQVIIAGRLMSINIQGKASFAQLQDAEGKIQVYFNRDEVCDGEDTTLYNEVYKKLLDIGDIIGIRGSLFTTQVGEPTIKVSSFEVLNKTDLLEPEDKEAVETQAARSDTVFAVSSITGDGLESLLAAVAEALQASAKTEALSLTFAEGRKRAWLFAQGVVEDERQTDEGYTLKVRWTRKQSEQFSRL